LPEVVEGRAVYRATPESFASHARALIEAGAGFIGGCCGTSPEFIKALNHQLSHSLRACWSTPIMSPDGAVLGAFAIYWRQPHSSTSQDQKLIEQTTDLASVAIERKRTEEALRASEERFGRMADTIPEVIWFTSLEPEKVLYVSPSFERIWGHPVGNLYENPRLWTEAIHPDDRERVTGIFSSWVAGEQVNYHNMEYRIVRPNGAIRWIHERGVRKISGSNQRNSMPRCWNSPNNEDTIMAAMMSREIRLVSRPKGIPTADNFALDQIELEPLQDQQVLIRNLFMSVDPYMRGRMNDGKSYVPPFELGKPLEGGAVGEVVESRAREFKPGDAGTSNLGWREYFIASPKVLHPVSREIHPLSVYLGALGMTGMTAWVGLNLVEVKAGDVTFISGAAGAVGNVAGQLAKLRGCRVIGSAGSAEKVKFLREECGFDFAFDYKAGPVLEQLNLAAPDGIDVYFDNVGGETLEAALSALRVQGRIIACGGISGYNEEKPKPGPSNLFNMIAKRLTMKGFIVRDWLDRLGEFEKEVGGYFRAGKLKNKETVVEGIDQAVGAFIGLFEGKNVGKMVVKLS